MQDASNIMQEALADLVTPWIVAYAIAVVASVAAIFVKVRVFLQQLRCSTHLEISLNTSVPFIVS